MPAVFVRDQPRPRSRVATGANRTATISANRMEATTVPRMTARSATTTISAKMTSTRQPIAAALLSQVGMSATGATGGEPIIRRPSGGYPR